MSTNDLLHQPIPEERHSLLNDDNNDPFRDSTFQDGDADVQQRSKKEEALEDNQRDSRSRRVWDRSRKGILITLVAVGIISLSLIFPLVVHFRNVKRKTAKNSRPRPTNITGQDPPVPIFRQIIDKDTPNYVKTRVGFDDEVYQLVFSDEFEVPGRTFYPGDDPYLEAMDMEVGYENAGPDNRAREYGWYDPGQVVTRDGALVLTMDRDVNLTSRRITQPPFDAKEDRTLCFRSGMVQSWNKLCFSSGYIEVSLILPGSSQKPGLHAGASVMGNLGRPGYRATMDGMWPYSYDECDVGTFPKQTLKDGSGPPAALVNASTKVGTDERFDRRLSVLSGQRLSACTCPNSDHPGPFEKFDPNDEKPRYRGRGAPEIGIFHAGVSANGSESVGFISQSAHFAPFSHDWVMDEAGRTIFDQERTKADNFTGNALQQSVSSLTKAADRGYVTCGLEYRADPKKREEGFITWQIGGNKTARMAPRAVEPDRGEDGSGAGQRLIPEEPMAILLSLRTGVLDESLDSPVDMLIDYIRIYQCEEEANIGCDPPGYPTTEYIRKHLDQYKNWEEKQRWEKEVPKNELYDGGC